MNAPASLQARVERYLAERHRLGFSAVRQAWRVARKRSLTGYGGQLSDLEVKVLYTPGKGKC